jgi:hypothetical protein
VGRTESVKGEEIGDEEKSYGEIHPVCQSMLSLANTSFWHVLGVTVGDSPVVPSPVSALGSITSID